MTREAMNIAASVHQRLLNKARKDNRPFNELLQYFAMERFLYRLSMSQYNHRFVLKGALMLRAHEMSHVRPTKDIDLLGETNNSVTALEEIFRTCCTVDVPADGILFDATTVRGREIVEEAEYHGVRITLDGRLGTAKIHLQIDLGFGDVIEPSAVWIVYPELLDFGNPTLLAYTLESAIAEKFQTIVKLDLANSRMKDFYDIWFLACNQTFDSRKLINAIAATFERRATPIPREIPNAFTEQFAANVEKKKQWSMFGKKIFIDEIPLQVIVQRIKDFLMPLIEALQNNVDFKKQWLNGEWN